MLEQAQNPEGLLEALQASEARFRRIIEYNADGIIIVNKDGIVRFVNPAAEDLLCRASHELIGEVLGFPLVSGETTEIDIICNGKVSAIAEMRVVEIDWEGSIASLASLRDITERKKAEADVRRLSQAIQQSPTSVLITDVEGLIQYINPQFTAITGYAAADVIGQNPRFLQSGKHSPAFYEDLWKTIKAGKEWRGVICNKKKNGELYWEIQSISPVRDTNGQITHYVAVKVDDTERQNAIEALERSEERYRQLFESANDAIIVTDDEGHCLDLNPQAEKLTGYNRDELLEMRLFDLCANDDARQLYHEVAEQGGIESKMVLVRKDGSYVHTELSAAFMADGHYQSTFRDATARRQAEQRTLELTMEREKVAVLERFLGEVSQDLRTPIAAMRMALYLLRILDDSEEKNRQLDILDRQTAQLDKLLDDMLNMLYLETTHAFQFALVNVNTVVAEVFAEQAPVATYKQQTVNFEPDEHLPSILADRIRLLHAIENVILNALQYTPKGGTVTGRTFWREGRVVVEIEDNGMGIVDEDLPHIFKRFYRGDDARQSSAHKGSGLGLSIAKKIIDSHHGKIEIDSTPGTGTCVRLVLPIAQSPQGTGK